MDDEKEPKIPVLTVFKNGAILKNIFIVNKPQSPPPSHSISDEEILVVGRHPDCNIVLTHPSVSRFHLQIISDPSSNKLSLIDLSSVHGTWVSDKRIEPGVRVELSQGDTLRVGASTRRYRLQWIPISRAYQLDQVLNCLPAEMESADDNQTSAPPMLQGGDKASDDVVQDKKVYDPQQLHRVNSLPIEHMEFESIELDSEVIETISSDDKVESIGKKILSVPSVLEEEYQSEDCSVKSSKCGAEEKQISNFWAFGTELLNLYFPHEESSSDSNGNQSLQSNCVMEHSDHDDDAAIVCLIEKEGNVFPTVQMPEETQNQSLLKLDEGQTGISLLSPGCFLTENPTREVNRNTENRQIEENNLTIETKSNLLVNMDLTQSDKKEEDANQGTLLLEDTEGKSTWRKDLGQTDNSFLPSGSLEHWGGKEEGTYPADQSISIIDHGHIYVDSCPSSVPLVMENLPLSIKEVVREAEKQQDEEKSMTPAKKSNSLGSLDFEHTDEVRCLFDETLGGTENIIVLLKDHELRDTISIPSVLSTAECINSSPPGRILTDLDDKEFQVPKSFCAAARQLESELCGSLPLRSDSVWARRGKPASAVQILTDRSRGKTNEAGIIVVDDDDYEKEEIYTPDKENFIPNTLRLRSLKMKGKVDTKQDDAPQEEELFTPDKENFTPVTPRQRSLKKNSKVEVEHSKSKSSLSKITTNFNIHREDLVTYTEQENQISGEITYRNQAALEKKLMLTKVKAERMPFQSLLQNSAGKNRPDDSVPNLAVRSSTSFNSAGKNRSEALVNKPLSNKSFGERKRGWTLVADATTLLNKETRNSLQLLQGLKGTHLIIPGMVIRELECLKQRGSLFRKKTEACLVLEWIEECMVNTNWWIHVQRSEEDERLIAPTPPAFPESLFSKNSWGFTSGTLSRSFMELLSPAAEDHILDCALLRRKMNNDGQVVLLSNDVTLKIKAMEEGLICETAQEFHERLVNPLSERFMWAGSCARGHTWSYLADIVPVEKYNRCSLKKSRTGEGAKGVKLILLHNSHYGQVR